MRKTFLLMISFISLVFCKDMFITLKKEPLHINNRKFYIKDLIDARPNQNNIGFAKTGIFNRKTVVKFKNGVRNELMEYFNDVLPPEEGQIPIIIKLLVLRVSEKMGLTREYARAEIKMAFYREKEGKLGKVYEAEAFYETSSGLDVTKDHEGNIRHVLKQCLQQFANSNWEKIEPRFEESNKLIMEVNESDTTLKNLPPEKGNVLNILLIGRMVGKNSTGFNMAYYRYFSNDSGWVFPYCFSWNINTVKNNDKQLEGVFSTFGASFSTFKRLQNSAVAILLDGSMYFGNEFIENLNGTTESNMFFGMGSSQNFLILPKGKRGLVFSLGVYEYFNPNSKLYPNGVGFLGQIGLQF
jgi:hypothetical protein